MIIFAKRLIERPTEWTLDGIVRHPQTHSLSNHRKNSRPNSNIHGCGLTKKIVNMKCITKVMNRNAKCKHVCFQSYTFTLYIVCQLSNNQTYKRTNKKVRSKLERNNESQVIKYITNIKQNNLKPYNKQ